MGFDFDKIMRMNAEEKEEVAVVAEQKVVQVSVLDLENYPAEMHRFKPASPSRMEELVDSIRRNGIINPLIVRPLTGEKYQILTGHNRRRAAIHLGYQTVPCLIRRDLSDDDAISIMISDNLDNRDLLPSERGWAYRDLMDILQKRNDNLPGRPKNNSSQIGTNYRADQSIGAKTGDSKNKVRRYIRLTYLIVPLLDLVDAGKIGLGTGEQLSYLKQEAQETVYAYCYASEPGHPLKEAQARKLREVQADPDQIIDEELLEELTTKQKKVRFRTLKLEMSKLRDYFPSGTPEEVVVQTIHTALAVYFEGDQNSSPPNHSRESSESI